MPRFFSVIAILLICVPVHALDLPAGISLDPPENLDLTYQIISSYDEKQEVIARWNGEKLQYFVSVEKLPRGYLDAKFYLTGLARDLGKAWSGISVGKQSTYTAASGLAVSVVEFSKPAKGDTPVTTLVVHFITDGKSSFAAVASPIAPTTSSIVFDETVQLFQAASITDPRLVPARKAKSEDELVGTWSGEESLADGRKISTTFELKSDLSFATTVTLAGKDIFAATGAWSKEASKIHWTYINTSPELPADKREDEDQIISITPTSITLKSTTNKERVFNRVTVNSNKG